MSDFFIKRPIFAWVLAIVIMLAGFLSILTLPVEQYPAIALPQVLIVSSYPGASAETLENTVTQIIEQNMNGIDNLVYMASNSQSSGEATTTLTFRAGTDADIAQMQVQNKLQLATPMLPQTVQQMGIMVEKASTSFLMVLAIYSSDGSMTDAEISDYLSSNIQDNLARINGVGQVQLFGAPHAMRIWIDPDKLSSYGLTVTDLTNALATQNVQIASGQLGGMPAVKGQRLNAVVISKSNLTTAEEFRAILIRVNEDGAVLSLGDVATVELGQDTYDYTARYMGQPASGIAISLAPGANALSVSKAVKDYVNEAKTFMPPSLEVAYPHDTTPFIRISIEEVVKTLIEAIILVFFVMFLFLQKVRVTLIPTIAIPVVLLGTFGAMAAAGFSINTLTMFGMVLAIGLLVDDAIVVVENVERVMEEENLPPAEAASKSMKQITSALVGIAAVLSAVFVPMAFFGGSTGIIYRQFSITIVSAMLLSVFVAIVLTPALCATLLKDETGQERTKQRGFFGWFNRTFSSGVTAYAAAVAVIVDKRRKTALVPYVVIVLLLAWFFTRIPTAFLPDEDQGILFCEMQLPSGATQERAMAVVKQVEQYFAEDEKATVQSYFTVLGYGFSGNGQNSAIAFVSLKDWSERPGDQNRVWAVRDRAMAKFAGILDAMVFAIIPPAVPDLGIASGFDLQLVDHAGLGHAQLMAARDKFMALAYTPEYARILTSVRPNGKDDTPSLRIYFDDAKASAQGVSPADVNATLQAGWGGLYVNDFVDKGRVKKVYLQGVPISRMLPDDLDRWYILNASGEMTSLATFTTQKWEYGSPRLERYNGLSSVEILGQPAAGQSTGQSIQAVERIIQQLPAGIGGSWTGLSYQEQQSGAQAPFLYALSLIVVFLALAALYESWAIPFSVMLVVPLGIIGVQIFALLFGQANDIYFQVGFLTVAGLSAKNAILIVEFAKSLHEGGKPLIEAALAACRMRIRPILMTSMATILGVLPLAITTGAGAGSQNAIGRAVIGGMVSNTLLGIFFVPLFFVLVQGLSKLKR